MIRLGLLLLVFSVCTAILAAECYAAAWLALKWLALLKGLPWLAGALVPMYFWVNREARETAESRREAWKAGLRDSPGHTSP